jgi:CDP-L-myo-inositol myo-inositolphosphotransferase
MTQSPTQIYQRLKVMTAPPTLSILFASEEAANYPVAGIPAAARAVACAVEAAESSESVSIVVPGGWLPSSLCTKEAQRLAPSTQWSAVDTNIHANRWISGADLQHNATGKTAVTTNDQAAVQPADITDLQRQAGRIIASTGKSGDGIVSRHINRPISQAMSRLLLHWPGIRPWHATLAAALIGAAMFAALLFGSEAGLLAGAVLFQLASIVDGVDGEIARATFRSSERGAMMDSVTDAATNLGFIGGVSYNLYAGGAPQAGLAGATGFIILALGSAILALQSRRAGGDFTFDGLKHEFRERPSRLKQWLIYITMRDFYAFAAFVAILAGGATYLLYVFAAVAAGWFAVLCWTMIRSAMR